MKKRLAHIFCLLLICCHRCYLQTAKAARLWAQRSSANLGDFHQRHLSAVYELEICRWIEDASCQLNPSYARHLLGSSNSNARGFQEAVLSDAACLSMTHEAACISRNTCEWVKHNSASEGITHSICQSNNKHAVVNECVFPSLHTFAMDYMACRRQKGGSCNRENNCENVQLSRDDKGCGIKGTKVLDLIINTPASQTELVAHLVQVAASLRSFSLPQLTIGELHEHEDGLVGGRRMVLQATASNGSFLAVDDDGLPTSGTSTTTTPIIRGTSSEEGEESPSAFGFPVEEEEEEGSVRNVTRTEGNKRNSTRSESGSSPVAEDVEQSAVSAPEDVEADHVSSPEEDAEPFAGSTIFNVSQHSETDVEKPGQEKDITPEDSLSDFIEVPLLLAGPAEHLIQVDITVMISLSNITEILDEMVSLMEEEQDTDLAFAGLSGIARQLENMRFLLDSQTAHNSDNAMWNTSDSVWWALQRSAQSLDAVYVAEAARDRTIMSRIAETLLTTAEEARDRWNPPLTSREHKRLESVESRLETILNRRPSQHQSESGDPIIINNLDKFFKVVLDAFNETLQEMYPLTLSLEFSEKYNQTWVQLFIERNQKWHAIRSFVAAEGTTGDQITGLLQGLYGVRDSRAHHSYLPSLTDLGEVVDDMVGAVVASYSGLYEVQNLPKELESSGLEIWQQGPMINANMLNTARRKAIQNLDQSHYIKFPGFLPASDKATRLLEAVIAMIDAKLPQHAGRESFPEETTILLTMEAGMDVITGWNNFALANNLDHVAGREPFGTEAQMDFTLSVVGCLTLGSDGSEQCRNMDRSPCRKRNLYGSNSTTGEAFSSMSHDVVVCAPEKSTEGLIEDFADVPPSSAKNLTEHIADLYLIAAHCPLLDETACEADERCSYVPIGTAFVCRPSSNFVNYIVEENQIHGLAAKNESCRAYVELPVCGNFKSQDMCAQSQGCLWTQPRIHPHPNGSRDMCIADWVEQLRRVDPMTVQENQLLSYNSQECQVKTEENECREENNVARGNPALTSNFPSHNRAIPAWLAFLLSVFAAVAVVWMLYAVRRITKKQGNGDGKSGKKAKGKKKGDQTPMPRGPPVPIHALEIEPATGSSQKKDDFDFVMEVFRTEPNSFTNTWRSRLHSPERRSDRNINNSIGEISEIQPDSESFESSTDSGDSDDDVGWTSSSEETSDDEDGLSLPDPRT